MSGFIAAQRPRLPHRLECPMDVSGGSRKSNRARSNECRCPSRSDLLERNYAEYDDSELYERLKIQPTLSINSRVCLDYPRLAQACKDASWEFMAHGFVQVLIHNEKDQAAMIERAISTIERFMGKRPVGWLGPGLTQTYETPDYLAALESNTSGIGFTTKSPQQSIPITVRL